MPSLSFRAVTGSQRNCSGEQDHREKIAGIATGTQNTQKTKGTKKHSEPESLSTLSDHVQIQLTCHCTYCFGHIFDCRDAMLVSARTWTKHCCVPIDHLRIRHCNFALPVSWQLHLASTGHRALHSNFLFATCLTQLLGPINTELQLSRVAVRHRRQGIAFGLTDSEHNSNSSSRQHCATLVCFLHHQSTTSLRSDSCLAHVPVTRSVMFGCPLLAIEHHVRG